MLYKLCTWLSGKEPICQCRRPRRRCFDSRVGKILGRFLGAGNGNPFQYSYLENPMDSGAWQATVHGVSRSQIGLSDWTTTAETPCCRSAVVTSLKFLARRNLVRARFEGWEPLANPWLEGHRHRKLSLFPPRDPYVDTRVLYLKERDQVQLRKDRVSWSVSQVGLLERNSPHTT